MDVGSEIISGVGAAFVALAGAVGYLFRENRHLTKKHSEADTKHFEELEKIERELTRERIKSAYKDGEIIRLMTQIENLSGAESVEAVIVADALTGLICEWSTMALVIFGWQKREIIGKPITTLIPDRYMAEHSQGWEKFVQTKIPKGHIREFYGLHKSGNEKPITVQYEAFANHTGQVFVRARIRTRLNGTTVDTGSVKEGKEGKKR